MYGPEALAVRFLIFRRSFGGGGYAHAEIKALQSPGATIPKAYIRHLRGLKALGHGFRVVGSGFRFFGSTAVRGVWDFRFGALRFWVVGVWLQALNAEAFNYKRSGKASRETCRLRDREGINPKL